MTNFMSEKELIELDPAIREIIELETERQNRKLIMIPSESSAPAAVRESLGSVLQNLYAEGYPEESTRYYTEDEILDFESQILNFRRFSDPRYYKGVEFADILEELARRRCAELFSNRYKSADEIFVNIQALSGAPANNAVYQALLEPGETILGMSLIHGGHLTHGSSVNRSGKLYNAFHYSVNPDTEQIDYDAVRELALKAQPKIIITGFSSYPWTPDWKIFRKIADEVDAYLFADVSHIAGPIAGQIIDSPVGYADVISFTTHKTLCGPRGACILSFKDSIARKIDKAVFPGEQGGPHIQVFAAMATTLKLAKTKHFKEFQSQILKNCKVLSDQLENRGLRIAYGGTNTHLTNIDCKSIVNQSGITLSGDMAARILDIAGIVTNANTIPGDRSARSASGIRLGTPWLTQRGLVEADMVEIANIIADLLFGSQPYSLTYSDKSRAKVDFEILANSKIKVRDLADRALKSKGFSRNGYPFFHYIDDFEKESKSEAVILKLSGPRTREFLNFVIPQDISLIQMDERVETQIFVNKIKINCFIWINPDGTFSLSVPIKNAGLVSEWLRELSNGYVNFDEDLSKTIPGPVAVNLDDHSAIPEKFEAKPEISKPFYIGFQEEKKSKSIEKSKILSKFSWQEEEQPLKRTVLYDWHKATDAKIIPFAGWEMPVWYSSVLEEHNATRNGTGLFDVTHMGVFEALGVDAVSFLDSVCANYIGGLKVGQSCYTHFLDPKANVIDDLLVYHHDLNKYLLVVNAANEAKDWAWLTAVKNGSVLIDSNHQHVKAYGRTCVLKNLKTQENAGEMRVDIAIQGPKSREILLGLNLTKKDQRKIKNLRRTELCHVLWHKLDLIISRTGYTGESMAFEIFIHPDFARTFWEAILTSGEKSGVKPCGLGARDSLRTEAGLPLYGHELAGEMNLSVGQAGFSSYVKTHKPWFIGRDAFMQQEKSRTDEVIRFRFSEKNVRMAHYGDKVIDHKGKIIGKVTSCAIDSSGCLTGQAVIYRSEKKIGSEISIFQNSNKIKNVSISSLEVGQKIYLPSRAEIIKRFDKFN